jgi:cytochrome oxidase assembly protein ShyY1
VYRFLGSPGWLGRLAAAASLAAVMALLGLWQLDRYEQRSAINERIDAASATDPAPLSSVLAPPGPGQQVGPAPAAAAGATMVTVTGRYDPEREILVRGRTLAGRVGVEVVTPLRLPDGTAVLVDRGWAPPAPTGPADRPPLPPPPAGEVTVQGWVRLSERTAGVEERDGGLHTRRIAVGQLADRLPYPLFNGYLLLAEQAPPADPALTLVPLRRENAWLNAGYAVQWWIFAGLVLAGFGWLVRRHARRQRGPLPLAPVAAAGYRAGYD